MKALDPYVLARTQRFSLRVKMVVDGVLSGMHRSKARGTSVEFSEHKEYSPGDDIRYIDWRAYARRDKYSIKKFEEESHVRAYFIVDQSASMQYRGGYSNKNAGLSKFEYAQLLAGSLAYILLHQRDAVGLLGVGGDLTNFIPPRSQFNHFENLLGQLEALAADFRGKFTEHLDELSRKLKERSLIFVLSDFFEPADRVAGFLRLLKVQRHEVVVFHLLDRWEIDFPFQEPVQFEDLESDTVITVDGRSIGKHYREEMKKFLESTREQCQREKINYRLVVTDRELDEVLVQFLADYK